MEYYINNRKEVEICIHGMIGGVNYIVVDPLNWDNFEIELVSGEIYRINYTYTLRDAKHNISTSSIQSLESTTQQELLKLKCLQYLKSNKDNLRRLLGFDITKAIHIN